MSGINYFLKRYQKISRAIRTDENGEFVMDVDKKYPTIDFSYGKNQSCEVALELSQARGAVWVGDVVCSGLSTYARTQQTGEGNES